MPKPSEEPEQQRPGDQRLVPELPVHVHQLDDDVEDRAGGEREEADRDRLADPAPARSECRGRSGRRRSGRADRGSATTAAPRSPIAARRCRSPSVALCSPKPMIRASASAISSCAADCPIASPSEKLCRPMPVAISSASQRAGRQADEPVPRRTRQPTRRPGRASPCSRCARDPAVVVDEGHQPGRRAGGEQDREPGEPRPRAAVVDRPFQRLLDRLDAVLDDLDEQEEQDAGRASR